MARIKNRLSNRIGFAHAQDYRSYVGLVTFGGHQCARTPELIFTFPKALAVTGALVMGRFRERRKIQDFPPMGYDFFLDVWDQDAKAWREESSAKEVSPEEHGAVWLGVRSPEVRKLRVRQTPHPGTLYKGFTAVRIYHRP